MMETLPPTSAEQLALQLALIQENIDGNSLVHPQGISYDVDSTLAAATSGLCLGDSVLDESQRRKVQNTTECVPVPSSEHVAEIVGRQGCKIKSLRTKTNTYIKTPQRGDEPVFIVTGRKEDVAAAKREILSAAEHFTNIRANRRNNINSTLALGHLMANTPGQKTIQVRVPYKVVGLVVGPKGATIKRIQQQTRTYIVTPSRDKEPVFEVTGLPENVELARKEIESHIALRTGQVDLNDDENNIFAANGNLFSDFGANDSLMGNFNHSGLSMTPNNMMVPSALALRSLLEAGQFGSNGSMAPRCTSDSQDSGIESSTPVEGFGGGPFDIFGTSNTYQPSYPPLPSLNGIWNNELGGLDLSSTLLPEKPLQNLRLRSSLDLGALNKTIWGLDHLALTNEHVDPVAELASLPNGNAAADGHNADDERVQEAS